MFVISALGSKVSNRRKSKKKARKTDKKRQGMQATGETKTKWLGMMRAVAVVAVVTVVIVINLIQ